MEKVSNRHEGDLGGIFLPFSETEQVDLTVIVSSDTANTICVQHTAWMLINLLARFDGVIRNIGFICPPEIITENVVLLAPGVTRFCDAVVEGAKQIGIVPVIRDMSYSRVIVVGATFSPIAADLYVHGEGWWGGASVNPIVGDCRSSLSFGPYIAACIAAGEVFKAARMSTDAYQPISSAFYSAWLHRASTTSTDVMRSGPEFLPRIRLHVGLAGVGAVGCAWIHAIRVLTDLEGKVIIADNDFKGLENTNLNRYVLFGSKSIGKPKASEAANFFTNDILHCDPIDDAFETLGEMPPIVVSAVDSNRARHSIQNRYPARVFSGSTLNLRAEVLRCGPPGEGACLRCFNPPEEVLADEKIRMRLREAAETEIQALADNVGITVEEANDWISSGKCGLVGERLLPFIRQSEPQQRQFAVSFVSVMAGTLLAAETIKEIIGAKEPLSDDQPRTVFQFQALTARTNGVGKYARDTSCPACSPDTEATKIWGKRYRELAPSRP